MSKSEQSINDCLLQFLKDPRITMLLDILGPDAKLHLVGGSVRDTLRGSTPEDLDLATLLLPDHLLSILTSANIRCIPTGLKHQTITAKPISELGNIEITTFRGPNMSPQGGVVRADTIEEDLMFRDFTVNAIAFDLYTNQIVDPSNGLKDIENQIIRCVGSPHKRYAEDPLRILRMIRLACQTGFSIEEQTKSQSIPFKKRIHKISIERVREELSKILLSQFPRRGLTLLNELDFLRFILPEVTEFVDFEQNQFHFADLFTHTLEVVENTSPNLILRLAALFHDVGKPSTLSINEQTKNRHFYRHESVGADMTKDILSRLKYPSSTIHDVCTLVRTHMRPLTLGPGGLRRLLRDTDALFPLWRALKVADASACKYGMENLDEELSHFDEAMGEILNGPKVAPISSLAIRGNDLIKLGIKEGPQIGKILRALHEKVLDDPTLNDKETLLKLVIE